MNYAPLPPGVCFIERDWLNANNILLIQSDRRILIDTGFMAGTQQTLALLSSPQNLGNRPLDRVINTHCHCDHVGGNAMLKSVYHCEITVPEGEAAFVRDWNAMALWLDYAHHRCEPFGVESTLTQGDSFEGGGLHWRVLDAPGHDMGALLFYCEEEQLLISGDALWEHSFGLVLPDPPGCLAAARATLEVIAQLDVKFVLPGHGRIFSNVTEALDRAIGRVEYFAQDPARLASHAIKAMFAFSLMDRGRMPLATLPNYLQRVPSSREMNAKYLGMSPEDLAQWLVTQMEKSGAAHRKEGWLVSGRP